MLKPSWSEGMFLRPHHMQAQDTYHEELARYQIKILNKYFWGLYSLDWNEDAISWGHAEVNRCELVLQDGTPIKLPGSAAIEPRGFESHLPGAGKPVSVYLGIRRQKSGESNCSPSNQEKAKTRFLMRQREVFDTNTGTNPCHVDYLEIVARLFFSGEEEILEDFESLKIAEIVETGRTEPRFEISKTYIPPCLTISSNRVLHSQSKRIMDILISKAKILTGQISSRSLSLSKLPASELLSLLMLNSINTTLPAIQHCVADGSVHPFHLYTLLGEVFGSLSTFSNEISSWEMHLYDHQNLGPCYNHTAEKIYHLLDLSVPSDYEQIPLTFDGEFFSSILDARLLDVSNRYFLSVRSSSSPPEALLESLPQKAKISSRESMEYLISHALGGIPLVSLHDTPPELPQRSNYAYFRLGEHESQWDSVRRHGNIAIYLDTVPEGCEQEIFILKS